MKNISTHCMDELKQEKEKTQGERECRPRKQTLDFLMQFARVYHTEPAIQPDVCGYVLN